MPPKKDRSAAPAPPTASQPLKITNPNGQVMEVPASFGSRRDREAAIAAAFRPRGGGSSGPKPKNNNGKRPAEDDEPAGTGSAPTEKAKKGRKRQRLPGKGTSVHAAARRAKAAEKAAKKKAEAEAEAEEKDDGSAVISDDGKSWGGLSEIEDGVFDSDSEMGEGPPKDDTPSPSPANMFGMLRPER